MDKKEFKNKLEQEKGDSLIAKKLLKRAWNDFSAGHITEQERDWLIKAIKWTEDSPKKEKVVVKKVDNDSYVVGLKDGIQAERDGVTYNPKKNTHKRTKQLNKGGEKK